MKYDGIAVDLSEAAVVVDGMVYLPADMCEFLGLPYMEPPKP